MRGHLAREFAFRCGKQPTERPSPLLFRLGVLDASELPPTFQADPSRFIAFMAEGDHALRNAVEGAEDSTEQGAQDLLELSLTPLDTVLGIASSGRTPYVLGALQKAKDIGCLTLAIVCTSPSVIGTAVTADGERVCEFAIECVTGPEVVTGSTRMRAGTGTKMILNMLSTGVMIKLGKT